jgi:hypothetical protein
LSHSFYFTFIQKEQLVEQYVDYIEHLTLTNRNIGECP